MTEKSPSEMYTEYKQKFDLPEFEKLEKFLEITCFEDERFVLQTIRKKINEKIHKFMEVLDPIVQPEASAVSMYENYFFSEEERSDCFEIYKKLMDLSRKSDLIMLTEDDEANAEFIKSFLNTFEQIKDDLQKIMQKQKDSWLQDSEINNKVLGYFG